MNSETKSMEERLNELYLTNSSKYEELLIFIKKLGAKVYRNSNGVHKIKYNINDVINNADRIEKEQKRRNMEAFMKGLFSK